MNFSVIIDNYRYLLIGTFPIGPLEGAGLTLLITLLSSIISVIFGFIFGILLIMLNGFWYNLLYIILNFFRAIPVIMLIFWIYFLLPILFNTDIPELFTIICALSLINSSYLANIIKSCILSITRRQWQAGFSLGLSKWSILWNIILPQTYHIMIPSIVNQLVALAKDTSLGYIIGVAELSFLANQINNREIIYSMEIFLFVGFVYFIICYLLTCIGYIILFLLKQKNKFIHKTIS